MTPSPEQVRKEFEEQFPAPIFCDYSNHDDESKKILSFLETATKAAYEQGQADLVKQQEAGNIPYYNMRLKQRYEQGRKDALDDATAEAKILLEQYAERMEEARGEK
jgi:hypothetical protein